MKKTSLFTFVLMISLGLSAQKMLTVEEVVMKQRGSLGPERFEQVQWIPGTHTFTYVAKKNNKEYIVSQPADNLKQRDTLLSIDAFKEIFRGAGTGDKLPERFPPFKWIAKDSITFFYRQAYFAVCLSCESIKMLNKVLETAENIEYEPITRKMAFTIGNNILCYDSTTWLSNKMNNKQEENEAMEAARANHQIITNDGSTGVVNGKAIHRNEFGISKGLFWSPKGNRLLYYKLKEHMVTNYPVLKLKDKNTYSENIKYPFAGDANHVGELYFYDFKLKRSIMVETNSSPDQYITNVCWSPDQEDIYVAVLNREQREMKLNKYDGKTGRFVKTLFTETHPKYIEPEHPMIFAGKNVKHFMWLSKRDGFNQLYLYDHNGRLIRQLTNAKADITDYIGTDKAGNVAYYMAATEDGLERHCFSVELSSGKTKRITTNYGVHDVAISEDGLYLIDAYSNISTPRRTLLLKNDGTEMGILQTAPNPLNDYQNCGIRLFSIPAADGTTSLNCRMFYPPAFDSTQKYPVLVYVYGGPHAQMITNSWLGGADMWLYYMAQQGYVVFTLDNRGSGNRGQAFEQATFRKLGTVEREDQWKGVEFLQKQRYVNTDRIGIFGWSFGGFMSINMMTRTPVFKAAVAGGPVVDWRMYEIMYTERYMDMPQTNEEGYKDADMTNYIKNLKGKMMLIHGTNDDVVIWQHSLKYIKKCIDEGVQVDYFVYPGHKHNVLGKDRVHLMQKVTDYFKQNL